MNDLSFPVKLLDPAQIELEEIACIYMMLAGKESAKRITDRIFSSIERLAQFPYSGTLIRDDELCSLGYRFLVVERYVLIYRVINDSVIIYHIFDGRSDYQSLFWNEISNTNQ